jgi:hypothetical protein
VCAPLNKQQGYKIIFLNLEKIKLIYLEKVLLEKRMHSKIFRNQKTLTILMKAFKIQSKKLIL